jgi:hypothetical protein
MKKESNSILLNSWLAKTLVDNPKLLENKNPIGIYADLQTIWLKEIQESFKIIIKEYGKLS